MNLSRRSQLLQTKLLQCGIIGAIATLMLSGCDVIRNMPPILPTFPVFTPQSPSSADIAQAPEEAQLEAEVWQQFDSRMA
jgi:hypothetical protein